MEDQITLAGLVRLSHDICFIVSREHVFTPDSVIVRDMYRRMRGNPKFTRAIRRLTYSLALDHHKMNRQFFYYVMG